ncbi:MAG: helicase, partial [Bifidobacterium sp.]|nr:helicase [Bifidobacterium sp.]
MTATNDDMQQQLDEALAKNEELQAKLDQVTKHSRQWEERAKANKTAADELEQLKAEHGKTIKEADELRAWKK